MKTPSEIIEARWPGWIAQHDGDFGKIPIFQLMAEAQAEALEFAAQVADLEDDGAEIARICRAKAQEVR